MIRQRVIEATDTRNEFHINVISEKMKVVDLIYKIRAGISKANSEKFDGGLCINDTMLKKAEIEARLHIISQWRDPLPANRFDADKEIDRVVNLLVARSYQIAKGSSSLHSPVLECSAANCTTLHTKYNEMYFKLKTELSELTDILTYSNSMLTIELSESDVELVKRYQLPV